MASTSNPNYITPNKTIEETVEIIKSKISTKTPFALTRFGDGEIYILNRSGGVVLKKKTVNFGDMNTHKKLINFMTMLVI